PVPGKQKEQTVSRSGRSGRAVDVSEVDPRTRRAPPREVARVTLPTPFGEFDARAFACGDGFVYVALIKGEVAGRAGVLVRLHSECLTGDALGSLRCDCGPQLRASLRTIAAEGTGVLVHATGPEGR